MRMRITAMTAICDVVTNTRIRRMVTMTTKTCGKACRLRLIAKARMRLRLSTGGPDTNGLRAHQSIMSKEIKAPTGPWLRSLDSEIDGHPLRPTATDTWKWRSHEYRCCYQLEITPRYGGRSRYGHGTFVSSPASPVHIFLIYFTSDGSSGGSGSQTTQIIWIASVPSSSQQQYQLQQHARPSLRGGSSSMACNMFMLYENRSRFYVAASNTSDSLHWITRSTSRRRTSLW